MKHSHSSFHVGWHDTDYQGLDSIQSLWALNCCLSFLLILHTQAGQQITMSCPWPLASQCGHNLWFICTFIYWALCRILHWICSVWNDGLVHQIWPTPAASRIQGPYDIQQSHGSSLPYHSPYGIYECGTNLPGWHVLYLAGWDPLFYLPLHWWPSGQIYYHLLSMSRWFIQDHSGQSRNLVLHLGAPTSHTSHPPVIAECWSNCICQEVCPCYSWCYHHWTHVHLWWSCSSQKQSTEDPWLAWVPEPYSSMWIPRCVWCPLNFYPGFCIHCLSAGQLNLKRSSVWMGRASAVGNAVSKGCDISFPCTPSPRLWIQMWGHPSSQHICYHSWIHFVAEGGWWKEVSKLVWLNQPYWSWELLFPSQTQAIQIIPHFMHSLCFHLQSS